MALAYVVRCNFNDASREAAWNAWYSGPKLLQMLSKPHFLTVQRFRRTAGRGRDYLAFWTLSSADAFTTHEYTSDWGFFEWKPYIADWSRDLFAAADGTVVAPRRVAENDRLRLVSFEGASAEEAEVARRTVEAGRPIVRWLTSVGLDRHTPLLGIAIEKAESLEPTLPGINEAYYRPISELVVSPRPDAADPAG